MGGCLDQACIMPAQWTAGPAVEPYSLATQYRALPCCRGLGGLQRKCVSIARACSMGNACMQTIPLGHLMLQPCTRAADQPCTRAPACTLGVRSAARRARAASRHEVPQHQAGVCAQHGQICTQRLPSYGQARLPCVEQAAVCSPLPSSPCWAPVRVTFPAELLHANNSGEKHPVPEPGGKSQRLLTCWWTSGPTDPR